LNKKLIAASIGLMLAANGAMAQSAGTSSVELYGILDVAVGHVANSLTTDGNFPNTVSVLSATKTSVTTGVTGMINGGIQGSRWGIRGSEDLGGGLKAIFTLESGFNGQDGASSNAAASLANNSPKATTVSGNSSLNGQLFNRQAFVGLSDATLGTLTFGRNYNPIFDIVADYDPVQASQLFSPLGVSATIGGGGGVSEDTRVDSSIKYKNKIGAVNFGGLYKFGGVAGNTSAQSGYVLNVGYEDGPFGIKGAYSNFTDALKTGAGAAAGQLSATNYDVTAFFIAAKYNFGDFNLKGGYETYTLKAPSDQFGLGDVSSLWGYSLSGLTNFASAEQTTDVWFVGGDYNFTPALNLAVGFYDQNAKQSDDLKQHNGNVYSYSALLDYHFTKRTDVYSGVLYSQYKGDQYTLPVVSDNSSNYVIAVGMRTKF
jgi:GBP family porin